jgi:hypothetical protein
MLLLQLFITDPCARAQLRQATTSDDKIHVFPLRKYLGISRPMNYRFVNGDGAPT